MSTAKFDAGMLELQGFQVEGVAQTLLAMSTSDLVQRDLGLSLDLLSATLTQAADYIAEHVEKTLTVERAADARRHLFGVAKQ